MIRVLKRILCGTLLICSYSFSAKEADQEPPVIELHFENVDLQNLVDYMAELFQVTFLTDDAIKPMLQSGKGVAGNKITFRTEKPMRRADAWNLFTVFLDMAGLSIIPTPQEKIKRIVASPAANKAPLPYYIGTDPDTLPDNDTKIRYVYFLTNALIDAIKGVVDQLRSSTSSFVTFSPLRALIITDKAYNIKALMRIVRELDKSSLPEMMSAIKLNYADADDVKKLFDDLMRTDDNRGKLAQLFGARKQADSFFFPENTRVLSEPRTNTLILFGTQDTIKKIEEFIEKIDVEQTDLVSPLYIYELQHTDAETMAAILNNVTKFGIGVTGIASGKPGEKYFKAISFIPEKSGNRLVIKADYEDYMKAKDIIEQLDVMQPQVAIEVLLVDIQQNRSKVFGSQMRNKTPDTIAQGVNFQNSGLIRSGISSPPVVDQNTGSIMANLITLATGNEAGSTLLTLGSGMNIWAIFKALSNIINATIISNPFLVTSNKYQATVSLGETRRIATGTVATGGNTLVGRDDLAANLKVVLTPQINGDGIITMDIDITADEFLESDDPTNGNRNTKNVKTKATMADKEVIAIGGLIRSTVRERITKVPLLGDIPLIGWFFKNRSKTVEKSNLLIFISPHIVLPKIGGGTNEYTQRKSEYSRKTLRATIDKPSMHDPVSRWFFKDLENPAQELDDFQTRQLQDVHGDVTQDTYYKNNTSAVPQGKRKNNSITRYVQKGTE